MSADDAAFINAICAAGADPYPRLVYADRLAEQGRADEEMFWRWAAETEREPQDVSRIQSDGWEWNTPDSLDSDAFPRSAVPADLIGANAFVNILGYPNEPDLGDYNGVIFFRRKGKDRAWLALRDAWLRVRAAEPVTSQ